MSSAQKPNHVDQVTDIIKNLTKSSEENQKLFKHAKLTDVKQFVIKTDDKKSLKALVLYLPYPYLRDHKQAVNKIINEVQAKTGNYTFVVAKRTVISKWSDYKQKIPKSRTLTDVCDAILEDLLTPGQIIGRRMRVRLNGTHLYKIFVNEESRPYLQDKVETITQIYHALTNRKIAIEFKAELNFAKVPIVKRRKRQQVKKDK